MPQEVDMLPGDRRDLLQQFQGLPVARRLIAVEYSREQNGVVGDHDICKEASALVANRDIQIGVPDQFLSPADLREHRPQLVVSLDTILRAMHVLL